MEKEALVAASKQVQQDKHNAVKAKALEDAAKLTPQQVLENAFDNCLRSHSKQHRRSSDASIDYAGMMSA